MSYKIEWWLIDLNCELSQAFSVNRGCCTNIAKEDNTTIIKTEPLIKGDKRFMLKKYGNQLVYD